ncbi:hypothetical protein UlMin_033686 [Ulmus minor]
MLPNLHQCAKQINQNASFPFSPISKFDTQPTIDQTHQHISHFLRVFLYTYPRLEAFNWLFSSVSISSTSGLQIDFHDSLLNLSFEQRISFISNFLSFASNFRNSVVLQVHTLVSTSNRAPVKLYECGLQQDLFLPFIATLKERCVVHEIGSSTDYRKLTLNQQGFYYIGQDLSAFLKEKFQELIGQEKAVPQEVEVVMGRKLQVPLGAYGCAYFPCDKPFGAADYFGYVPIFGLHNRTVVYQFVTLVDVMYENKAKLLCTAEGNPLQLFEKIVTIADAQFVAPRTSSRKIERKENGFLWCLVNKKEKIFGEKMYKTFVDRAMEGV